MDKKQQSSIAANIQKIMDAAVSYSEKKLKHHGSGRFHGTSTQLDIELSGENLTENKSKAQKSRHKTLSQGSKNANKKLAKQKVPAKLNASSQEEGANKPKQPTSPHKKRKKVWQKDIPNPNSYISLIDKGIDYKKIRGKSLLCVGGVNSGKIGFAFEWANAFGGTKAFIATMENTATLTAENEEQEDNGAKDLLILKRQMVDLQQGVAVDRASIHLVSESQPNTEKNRRGDLTSSASLTGYYNTTAPVSLHAQNATNMYRIHTQHEKHLQAQKSGSAYFEDIVTNEREVEHIADDASSTKYEHGGFHAQLMHDTHVGKHKKKRAQTWVAFEEPDNIIYAIDKAVDMGCSVAVIDCIPLWITNLLLQGKSDQEILHRIESLAHLLKAPPLPVAMVTNEVGSGILCDNFLAGRYRDLQGTANQILAQHAHNVIIAFCGLPVLLKEKF